MEDYNSISMYSATVTSQGQITVPAEVRDDMNIKPGDKLVFWPVDDKYEISKDEGLESLGGIFAKYAVGKPKLTKKRLEQLRVQMYTERYKKFLDKK